MNICIVVCKHEGGRACGRACELAWMYMIARACVRSYVCMYVSMYLEWDGDGGAQKKKKKTKKTKKKKAIDKSLTLHKHVDAVCLNVSRRITLLTFEIR